jgi:protein-disulfide isomerase
MAESKKVKIEFDQVTAWKIATIILGILFIVSIATGGFGSKSGSGTIQAPTPTLAPQPTIPTEAQYIEVSVDDDPVLGDKNAPITIIEFSDYQCPFCKRAFDQTLPDLKKNYIEKGKVKLVFRDLPLPFHTEADEAAIAANCAGAQGKYWEMHDVLFQQQSAWAGQADPKNALTQIAKELGVNEAEFTSCYNDPATRKEVEADYADAGAAGATGTPTFFINGRKLVGAQPYQAFEAVIEDELKKA